MVAVGGGEFKSEEMRKDFERVAENGILFVVKRTSFSDDIKEIEHPKKNWFTLDVIVFNCFGHRYKINMFGQNCGTLASIFR